MKVLRSKDKIVALLQILFILLSVAFYTLMERKLLGYIQNRKGPNKPSFRGILVPFADALKLLTKEINTPTSSNFTPFLLSPLISLSLPLILWVVYPTCCEGITFIYSVLWFVCVSALVVYAILVMGWRSNRSYSFLGSVRSVAQSVSYEACLTLLLLHFILYYQYHIMITKLQPLWVFLFLPMSMLFVAALAETNRTPFDFAEGESELVRGFNTEYRSTQFVIIFLGEYLSILFMAVFISALFNMRGYLDLFFFVILWSFGFVWCRGTLPRIRYDHLMYLAWKTFLPMSLCAISYFMTI